MESEPEWRSSEDSSLNGIQTSLIFKRPTSSHAIILPSPTTISTGPTTPFEAKGTAILIKRSIPHREIIINNQSFETTAIKIEGTNMQPITVISAYRSPRKPISVHDLHHLFRNQDYVLVAGDLNAKHASWCPIAQQNVAGHTIRRFCEIALDTPSTFHWNPRIFTRT
ncbi:hypothetical protein TNCV_2647711 [Trichonephila clavipes]|nr:hypothetical protein TNCV_2647711 [Trichonephila clavipes]